MSLGYVKKSVRSGVEPVSTVANQRQTPTVQSSFSNKVSVANAQLSNFVRSQPITQVTQSQVTFQNDQREISAFEPDFEYPSRSNSIADVSEVADVNAQAQTPTRQTAMSIEISNLEQQQQRSVDALVQPKTQAQSSRSIRDLSPNGQSSNGASAISELIRKQEQLSGAVPKKDHLSLHGPHGTLVLQEGTRHLVIDDTVNLSQVEPGIVTLSSAQHCEHELELLEVKLKNEFLRQSNGAMHYIGTLKQKAQSLKEYTERLEQDNSRISADLQEMSTQHGQQFSDLVRDQAKTVSTIITTQETSRSRETSILQRNLQETHRNYQQAADAVAINHQKYVDTLLEQNKTQCNINAILTSEMNKLQVYYHALIALLVIMFGAVIHLYSKNI